LRRSKKIWLGVLTLIIFSSALAKDRLSPLVLAFYYPWYRTLSVSGYCTWNFGGNQYEERDRYCEKNHFSAHFPKDGLYDTLDPEVIFRQLQQSISAGIDGWIVSWWGRDFFQPDPLFLIFEQIEKNNFSFKISIYYEQIPGCQGYKICSRTKREIIKAVKEDFQFLRENYFSHPAYLKVDHQPVVFIYIRALLQGKGVWKKIQKEIERGGEIFLSGDCGFSFIPFFVGKRFEQVHFYNPVSELIILGTKLFNYSGFVRQVRARGQSPAITIIPGYDERKLPDRKGLFLKREQGKIYSQLWEKALRAQPDWILITSFNEWYEGTEIEPSQEFGEFYLELTKKYSKLFHQK